MKVLVRTPYPISLLTRTYISRRADLYWFTRRAILVDEATYIGSPADQYRSLFRSYDDPASPPVLERDEMPRTDSISHHSVRESGLGKRADTYCSVFCFGRV